MCSEWVWPADLVAGCAQGYAHAWLVLCLNAQPGSWTGASGEQYRAFMGEDATNAVLHPEYPYAEPGFNLARTTLSGRWHARLTRSRTGWTLPREILERVTAVQRAGGSVSSADLMRTYNCLCADLNAMHTASQQAGIPYETPFPRP